MKLFPLIFLLILFSYQTIGQDVDSLKRVFVNNELTTVDSINTLILLGRELTYVDASLALEYTNKVLELSLRTNNLLGTAYAYRNLSGVYSFDGSFFISMEYLQRALDIFKLKNDSVGLANCYISLGHTNRRLQNRKEEVEYHLKAFEIFRRRADIERLGVSSHNLGESYYHIGDLEKSRELTLYAIKINESINKLPVLSACYKVLGLLELELNNIKEAEKHFLKVLELSEQLGLNSQKVATAESFIQLSKIARILAKDNLQFDFLLKAAEFSAKNNLPKHSERAYRELILFSSERNQQQSVRAYIEAYTITLDSLNQKQLRDRRNLTKTVVEVHELSKTKIDLEKANLIQEQKIKSRNIILSIIFFSAFLLLWLLIKFGTLNRKLKAQNSIIESQNDSLEKLNNTKDRFFSIVAHDLKSPLISLKSFSNMLLNHFDILNKEDILEMSKKLGESVDNTVIMANNLITWASIQMDEHQYNEEVFNLNDVVLSIFELQKEAALKKKIQIINKVDESISLIGDKNQIEFIIRNLINNAIKFTDTDGKVEIRTKLLSNGLVKISIADNGIGIQDNIKNKLFSVGQKQSLEGTAGEKGTGLGLMLSYEFMKLHGGGIEVESDYGIGTTFHLTFRAKV